MWKSRKQHGIRILLLVFLFLAMTPLSPAAEGTPELTYTLRGRLTYPETGTPLVGARVQFSVVGGTAIPAQITDELGQFEIQGLRSADLSLEITTAEGKKIKGINSLKASAETLEIIFKISNRVESSVQLESQPERFVALVERKRFQPKVFWRGFGIFFAIAATGGALVL